VDWEVELAVISKKKASYVSREQPADSSPVMLFTTTIPNEASSWRGAVSGERKERGHIRSAGAVLATRDEVPNLPTGMWLTVNGEFRQKSTTAEMIFDRTPRSSASERVYDALAR